MNCTPKISRLGKQSILLKWDFDIATENLFWLLSVKEFLNKNILKSKHQIVNTYNSLLINYDISIESVYDDFKELKIVDYSQIKAEGFDSNLYRIPVCYDADFGLDLDELASRNSLTEEQIIELHTAPIYTLYFMGFLPGFLYLGGMDERLRISRKKEPRKSVLKGAVGIAENQTGIYPNSSPAGWQIIGNSPIDLFNSKVEKPSPFTVGDRIQFYVISKEEHKNILEQMAKGDFELKPEVDV